MINQSLYGLLNMRKKHHYLPRYYLKGFTNNDNGFFVYDKQKDNIFSSSPDDSFFENYLNTAIFPDGSSSDFLEDMYTDLENSCWPSLDTIRKSTYQIPISLFDKMQLFLFLLFLYWRLPSNTRIVEKLAEKAFIDNNEVDYFKLYSKTGEKVPKEIADVMKQSPAFKKAFRQIVPFIPFYKDKDWATKVSKWKFLYTADEKSWYIVGDNPIITRENDNSDVIDCFKEFVFPVSGKILLINVNKLNSKEISREFGLEFNTAIIERAKRFVACQNKDFLEALIKYYKFHVEYQKTDVIIPNMFEMLDCSQ
jgi:hypothetical protein